MLFLFKQIKPKPLKIDAFRLEFLTALHEIERGVKKDFQEITETWEHEVVWESQISLVKGPSMLVGSDDQILRWLNDGTPPHNIWAKKSMGYLQFQTGFKPKTKVNWIGSQKGGKFGAKVKRATVRHPGFEARNYEKVMKEKWEPKFKDRMKKAMKTAAKKSGHGV